MGRAEVSRAGFYEANKVSNNKVSSRPCSIIGKRTRARSRAGERCLFLDAAPLTECNVRNFPGAR